MTDPYRLPREVLPRHYRLVLEPNLAAATFRGTATIDVDVVEPVDRITLNALDLEISSATITYPAAAESNGAPRDLSVESDIANERVTLLLDAVAPAGPAVLEFTFTGVLNDQLRGFYRSTFTDEAGAEHTIATTQFQSTDARRAFPCFDEPDFKASFGVTLVVDPHLLAISNSSEIGRESQPDGRVAVHFDDTIPMSTYLVAFVVGPLEASDPIDVDGIALRVIHRPGQEQRCAFSLDVAEKALRYFTEYYAIPYPGSKVDLVAIPDFAFGAMENLGCVTFREIALLADPHEATQPELQRIADVVNHELAHMWFGDLVTMRWWNGIWLNEAFATFMETKATDQYRPDWNRWVDFGLSKSMAYDIDALESTRPVEYDVTSPAEAEGMFDVLTYEKGASVVRMLEQYLGEDEFRDGIRHYLHRHQLSNTETDDLWAALEETTGEPVRELMAGWIFQGGVPLVSYADDDGQRSLSQSRFRYFPGPDDDASWQIPMQTRVDGLTERLLLTDSTTLAAPPSASLPVLNAESTGYYRVQHPEARLLSLDETDLEPLSALERYVLLDDAWALVLADAYAPATFLHMARAYHGESDGSVWQRLTGALATLHHLTADEHLADFEAQVEAIVGPAATAAGWAPAADEDDRTRQRRATLLTAAGITGNNGDVQAHARAALSSTSTPPELESAAVEIVAASGTEAEFEDFWRRYEHAEAPQVERRYLNALATFPEREQILTIAKRSLGDSIRSQDGPFTLAGALSHREHGADVWQLITDRWDQINDRFPTMTISRMLGGVRSLATPELAASVKTFLEAHPIPQGAQQVEQHLERQAVNVRLRQRLADG